MKNFDQVLARSSFGSQESMRARRSTTAQQQSAVMKKISEKQSLSRQKRGTRQ